jgi:hypothetical protein
LTENRSFIDDTTTSKMPKEVKQKSGLIVGLNAGHSTFAPPPPSIQPDRRSHENAIFRKASNVC